MNAPRVLQLGLLMVGGALALTGCAHHFMNRALSEAGPHGEYRYWNLPHEGNSDELFVCLTFSGGGGRAAALSFGVLKQLRDTEIEIDGQRRRLLDEVDVISSVSGGSFTAAYYALHRDKIFDDYLDRFLLVNYQRRIVLTALNPLQWFRYISPNYSLTDRAAEVYDRGLYEGATYGDLIKLGRPYIILNATDITLGQPFQFTQDQFDFLQSDMSTYPIARAVTASSAVPVALTPITLKAYHDDPEYSLPDWVQGHLASREYPSLEWQQADQLAYYADPSRSQYVHLVDGGIADNLGARPVLSPPRPGVQNDLSVRQMVDRDRVRHVVLIMINAANKPESDWTLREKPPGAVAVLNKSIGGLMSGTTASMSRALRERMDVTQKTVSEEASEGLRAPVTFTTIEVGFAELEDEEERSYFFSIATTLGLTMEAYERLIWVGESLLANNPEYLALVESFNGTIQAPGDPPR